MTHVGFIGLGTMGRHMAKNLLKAGFPLTFFARRDEVAREFIDAGARRAASPADVARAAEITITIVTADAQVREVVGGPGGLVEGISAGKLVVDMSTIGPSTVRDVGALLAAKGARLLDAPVSGGPWGAEAGSLAIMVGGEAADYERATPLFRAMGKHLFHCGALGAGQIVKLVNQMIGGGIMTLVAEGMVLAKKAGANMDQVVDVLSVSSANSALLEARGKKFLLADQFKPGFMTELMRKDMSLAVALADQLKVPTPVAAGALQQFTAALNCGLAELDFSAVAKVYEQQAGVKIAGAK
jgi:3-hydroxyisobutyrate dehydrogenase-like beta-hydroxyacid dehydrogenase